MTGAAVMHRSVTAEARFRSRSFLYDIVGEQLGDGTGLSPVSRAYFPPMHDTHVHINTPRTRRTRGSSVGTFKKQLAFVCRGTLDTKYCYICFSFLDLQKV
jgi:hypothetical protein